MPGRTRTGRTFFVFLFSAFGDFDPIFTAKTRSLSPAYEPAVCTAGSHTNSKKSRDAERKEEIRDEGREGREVLIVGWGKVRTEEDG